ncbi:MAG: hypothetical protein PHX30_05240 [Candidatus Pacebacteria bacterium]|nr:hypothetical protein [Candidatus Paceibacterota bacterium]
MLFPVIQRTLEKGRLLENLYYLVFDFCDCPEQDLFVRLLGEAKKIKPDDKESIRKVYEKINTSFGGQYSTMEDEQGKEASDSWEQQDEEEEYDEYDEYSEWESEEYWERQGEEYW